MGRESAARHERELERLREVLEKKLSVSRAFFSLCDTNDNGQLDKYEFRQAIAGMRGDVPDSVCDDLFREFDEDGSGEISYHEFIAWMLRRMLRQQAHRVMAFFRELDKDATGEIEKWMFRRGLRALGFLVPTQMIDSLFDGLDKDGSGSLSYREMFKGISRTGRPKTRSPTHHHVQHTASPDSLPPLEMRKTLNQRSPLCPMRGGGSRDPLEPRTVARTRKAGPFVAAVGIPSTFPPPPPQRLPKVTGVGQDGIVWRVFGPDDVDYILPDRHAASVPTSRPPAPPRPPGRLSLLPEASDRGGEVQSMPMLRRCKA